MERMKILAVAVVVALGACGSKSKEAAPAGSASASASGSASASDDTPPAPYTPAADVPKPIKDAIAAPDRTLADRRLDAGRKPGEVLAFFRIAPGQKVGELFAGGGTTTELLARVVGDKGTVYAENAPVILEKFARKPWTERLARPAMKGVVSSERDLDAPFPPEATNLDAVIMFINYHDTVAMKVDRAKMNAAVFAALKPGGIFGIVDSSAVAGSGTRDSSTLHRIDEDLVKQEVTAAGFKLDASSDVLRNPDDKRDWNSSPRASGARRGTSDRFVLRFVKP
jgi:predicted methyltransferase